MPARKWRKYDRDVIPLWIADHDFPPPVEVKQATHYPWAGKVLITLVPQRATKFTVNVRIPGWVWGKPVPSDLYRYADTDPGGSTAVAGLTIRINGEDFSGDAEVKGFLPLTVIPQ